MVENTSTSLESLEVSLGELNLKSDWKKYYGSSDELNEERRRIGNDAFRREIISLHTSKGRVNYEETRQLFINNVLTERLDTGDPKFYNSNVLAVISGRIISMDQTQEEMLRDLLVDRLHELVNDGRLEDAVSLYEEHKSLLDKKPSVNN